MNRIKATLARLGIRNFKPTLRKARPNSVEGLAARPLRRMNALSGAASGECTIAPASPPDGLGPRRSGQAY